MPTKGIKCTTDDDLSHINFKKQLFTEANPIARFHQTEKETLENL